MGLATLIKSMNVWTDDYGHAGARSNHFLGQIPL